MVERGVKKLEKKTTIYEPVFQPDGTIILMFHVRAVISPREFKEELKQAGLRQNGNHVQYVYCEDDLDLGIIRLRVDPEFMKNYRPVVDANVKIFSEILTKYVSPNR